MIIKLVGAVNDLLWGDLIILEFSGGDIQFGLSLLVLILIPAGLYFTFKTRFLPFRLFPEMIRVTLEKDETKKDENSISGVQALIVATATRVGMGDLGGGGGAVGVGGVVCEVSGWGVGGGGLWEGGCGGGGGGRGGGA